jgi:hypothetical protein
MSLAAFKVLHLLGIVLTFSALGALWVAAAPQEQGGARRLAGMTHGVGLLLVLFAGFGLLGALGLGHNPAGWPLWLWLKLVIWLALGAAVVVLRRAPGLRGLLWWGLPLLGAAAAYLAFYKPGA